MLKEWRRGGQIQWEQMVFPGNLEYECAEDCGAMLDEAVAVRDRF
jgi:hypothetical protein